FYPIFGYLFSFAPAPCLPEVADRFIIIFVFRLYLHVCLIAQLDSETVIAVIGALLVFQHPDERRLRLRFLLGQRASLVAVLYVSIGGLLDLRIVAPPHAWQCFLTGFSSHNYLRLNFSLSLHVAKWLASTGISTSVISPIF